MRVELRALCDVFEDDYEQGYGNNVNYFELPKESYEVKTKADIKKALESYFEDVACYSFEYKYGEWFEDDRFSYSVTVANDNSEASEYELEKWRNGELKLYACDIQIYFKVISDFNIDDFEG